MGSFEERNYFDTYVPPKDNRYDYCDFRAEEWPEAELLAKQIQAQSYVDSGFVRPEGLVTLENGEQILASDIAVPAQVSQGGVNGAWTEYSIGIEKGSIDTDPVTGKLVAWKKSHAPLDALSTYQYCRDSLWPDWEGYLRGVDAYPALELVEPEALGKTKNAGRRVVTEFMRNEVQRAQGKGEIWFMGLVEKTVYRMFVRHWGPLAVRQIGEPKRLVHPDVDESVMLVPTVMDIDCFFQDFYDHIVTFGDEIPPSLLANFVYMTEGVSDAALGSELADFRRRAKEIMDNHLAE